MHGLPIIKGVNKLCDGCAGEPLELVHGDICGPIKSATPGGKRPSSSYVSMTKAASCG